MAAGNERFFGVQMLVWRLHGFLHHCGPVILRGSPCLDPAFQTCRNGCVRACECIVNDPRRAVCMLAIVTPLRFWQLQNLVCKRSFTLKAATDRLHWQGKARRRGKITTPYYFPSENLRASRPFWSNWCFTRNWGDWRLQAASEARIGAIHFCCACTEIVKRSRGGATSDAAVRL